MPRPSKGIRLRLHTGKGRTPTWVIIGGKKPVSTRCGEGNRAEAERQLAKYILAQRDPAKAIDKNNPNAAKIADVLSLEMQRIVANATMPKNRKAELITVCDNMVAWFGERVVGDLDGDLQERYAA